MPKLKLFTVSLMFLTLSSFSASDYSSNKPSITILTPTLGQKIAVAGVNPSLTISVVVTSDCPIKSVIMFFDENGDGIEEVKGASFNSSANIYQAVFDNLSGTGNRTFYVHATDNYLQTSRVSRKIELTADLFDGTRISTFYEDLIGTGEIKAVAYSSDGTKALIGGGVSGSVPTAFLMDLENKRVLQQFNGHVDQIVTVEFSPVTDTIIATGSNDGTAKVWNANNGKLIQDFQYIQYDDNIFSAGVPGKKVNDIEFSPDGTKLLVASDEVEINDQDYHWTWLWDISTGDTLRTFRGTSQDNHSDDVIAVDWSPTGDSILTGSEDQTIKLWRVSDASILNTFSKHANNVNDVSFSANGERFLSCDQTGNVVETNLITGQEKVFDYVAAVREVSYSFDEQKIIAVGNTTQRGGKVWDRNSELLLLELRWPIRINRTTLLEAVATHPTNNEIITGGEDGKLIVWDVNSDNTTIIPQQGGGNTYFDRVAVSNDGDTYAIRHNSKDFAIVKSFSNPARADTIEFKYTNTQGTVTFTADIQSLSFSPDGGKVVAAVSANSNPIASPVVVAWDVNSYTNQKLTETDRYIIDTDVVLPANRNISGSDTRAAWFTEDDGVAIGIILLNDTVLSWRLDNAQLVNYLLLDITVSTNKNNNVSVVPFVRNSQILIAGRATSGSDTRTIKLWDLKSETLIKQNSFVEELNTGIFNIDFTLDGKNLIINESSRIIIWDIDEDTNLLKYSIVLGSNSQATSSSDGRYIFVGISTTSVNDKWEVFDLQSNRFIRTKLNDVDGSIEDMKFIPNTDSVVVVGDRDHIRIFDALAGSQKAFYEFAPNNQSSGIAITNDNTLLLQGTNLERTILWDVSSKAPLFSTELLVNGRTSKLDITDKSTGIYQALITNLTGNEAFHFDPAKGIIFNYYIDPDVGASSLENTAIKFAPDGNNAAMGFGKNTRFWNLNNGSIEQTISNFVEDVHAIAYADDGNSIAVGSGLSVRRFETSTGNALPGFFDSNTEEVLDVDFSPDGLQLASSGKDDHARLWNINEGGSELYSFYHLPSNQSDPSLGIDQVRFSSNGDELLTAYSDRSFLWNTNTGQLLRIFEGQLEGSFVSTLFSNQNQILSSRNNDPIIIYNSSTKEYTDTLGGHGCILPPGSGTSICTPEVTAVAISPDGNSIVTGGFDRQLFVWDSNTGQQINTLSRVEQYSFPKEVIYDNTGARLLYVDDRGASFWDPNVGEYLGQEFAYPNISSPSICTDADFSPDGTKVITVHNNDISFESGGFADGTYNDAVIWDIQGDTIITPVFDGHDKALRAVDFSPDGTKLVTGSDDGTARVWDVASRNTLLILRHDKEVAEVAFSPDGSKILSGENNGPNGQLNYQFAYLWDANNGNLLAKFMHPKSIKKVQFSADGTKALTMTSSTAYVWDINTGQLEYGVSHSVGSCNDAVFSPDGNLLITGGSDNLAKVWDISN